ncbi:MAG: heavy metal-responsive transcriptional regulator [Alphaproteobacteria bacterium]|nr:heavy metal-responsive transcriptional regulator [Alphaproteobacteria bacterium]
MLIGDLAKKADVSIDTIRYYEREGLIEPVSVRDSGYREFDKNAAERLRFVTRAKQLGFSLKEIRDLLSLTDNPDTTCGQIRALAEQKLEDVLDKIKVLQIMKKDLTGLLKECTDTSASINACPIVDALDGKEKQK